MDMILLDKLLLKTAFSCMACDGDIDDSEVELLKNVFDSKTTNSSKVVSDINELLSSLNKEGKQFLTNFTKELRLSNLSEDEELQIVQIALRMIYADNTVKYSELKYFKLIRLSLKVSGELILKKFPSKTLFLNTNEPRIIDSMPEIEQFLEEDIMTESYLEKITSQYLEIAELPQFELIPLIGTDSLGKLTKNE